MVQAASVFWSEKYRPICLDQVLGNKSIVSRFKAMTRGTLINLLLYGDAGCGKTTIVKCFVRDWFKHHLDVQQQDTLSQLSGTIEIQELLQKSILELNASDDRKIETIRTTIRNFAKKSAMCLPGVATIQ